ncbi:hypothetical protein ACFY1L_50905 [Streptomyces sp. NPDC001663]|uniref:hypothetical protein n=1 Tax=Streptomyces sp. NPDC001663 TaxID=3364597 RepID=UPI00367A2F26
MVVALAGAFCVLVFGLAPLLQGGYMLAGALGLVGHRAVFTAAGCHLTGTGKNRHNVCEGELVEAHRPQRYASIAADVPLDRATPVQVLPTGWLETVGPAAVTGWSTLGLGGLTGLTAASLVVFRGRVKPPSHSIGRRLFVVLASLTLTGLVVYVVVRAVT